MNLYEIAKRDIADITSNPNEWGAELTFTGPNGETAVINGLKTNIGLKVDYEGNMVNSKKTHVAFSESKLIVLGYPTRIGGEVNLGNHKVSLADSSGKVTNWTIRQWFPDETIDLISCILSIDGNV